MYPAKFKMVVENEEDVAKVLSILGLPSYYFDKNSDISYLFYDKECCGSIPLTYTTGSISGASAKRRQFPEAELSSNKKDILLQIKDSQEREYTGGSVSYYTVDVLKPTSGGEPYTAECNDIIESLQMSFAEGNIFKAIWRLCAARQGKSKDGYRDSMYDAEKIKFFAERIIAQLQYTKADES